MKVGFELCYSSLLSSAIVHKLYEYSFKLTHFVGVLSVVLLSPSAGHTTTEADLIRQALNCPPREYKKKHHMLNLSTKSSILNR